MVLRVWKNGEDGMKLLPMEFWTSGEPSESSTYGIIAIECHVFIQILSLIIYPTPSKH